MNDLTEQIKELLNERNDFVILLDQEGSILFANQQWVNYCEQHKLSSAQWNIGANYLNFLDKSQKVTESQSIKEVLEKTVEEQIQLSPLFLIEGMKWLKIKVRPFPFPNGSTGAILYQKLICFGSIDIQTEHVLEGMKEAFFLLDEQMCFSYLNTGAENLLKQSYKELIGKNIWTAFPRAVECSFYQACLQAKIEMQTKQIETFSESLGLWLDVKVNPTFNGGLTVFFTDISEKKLLASKLENYTYFDPLTGLPNRLKIENELDKLIKEKVNFSLLYVNIDKLKYINSLHTHHVGDELLKSVAVSLNILVNEDDIVGRFAGDGFVIIHKCHSEEQATKLPQAVQDLFISPFSLNEKKAISVSVSIGVVFCPWDSANSAELLAYGETAMREAKKQSSSSFVLFRPTMSINYARRTVIEKDLSDNLRELGFHFALQPQVNAITGKLCGVEALARWNHPEIGMISPVEFIDIAEETGTITSLTLHLLHAIFANIKEREARFGCSLRTAINMTPSLLVNNDFFTNFFLLLEQYEVPPELIEIEITESIELTYSETTLHHLLLCREKGISIALDDFGTGFSMIAYLTQFPIDKIKLDKFFIQKISEGDKSKGVLKSLIQFVHSIGCKLVAEGVEEIEEAEFLITNDCEVHQGYFYDKPMTPADFDEKYLVQTEQLEFYAKS